MIHSTQYSSLSQKEESVKPLLKGIASGNSDDLKVFFEIFSDDIYNFPIKYFQLSEDEAGEFYLYAFEHLKNGKKFSSFKQKSKFTTWFFSVLRNLVLDYLRKNKNKLKMLPLNKLDSHGSTLNVVDNLADTHSSDVISYEEEMLKEFYKKLESLKINNRILFKLAFFQYTELTEEEIQWLSSFNNKSADEIKSSLTELKEVALKKSNEVRSIEDKLTANFQNINILENKIINFLKDHPSLDCPSSEWTEDYENADIPLQLNTWIKTLMKKKKQHVTLLQNQQKSLLCTRLPYKHFAHLLQASEGVLSVQLLRIIEKLYAK